MGEEAKSMWVHVNENRWNLLVLRVLLKFFFQRSNRARDRLNSRECGLILYWGRCNTQLQSEITSYFLYYKYQWNTPCTRYCRKKYDYWDFQNRSSTCNDLSSTKLTQSGWRSNDIRRRLLSNRMGWNSRVKLEKLGDAKWGRMSGEEGGKVEREDLNTHD